MGVSKIVCPAKISGCRRRNGHSNYPWVLLTNQSCGLPGLMLNGDRNLWLVAGAEEVFAFDRTRQHVIANAFGVQRQAWPIRTKDAKDVRRP